jgi:hypothetical protein
MNKSHPPVCLWGLPVTSFGILFFAVVFLASLSGSGNVHAATVGTDKDAADTAYLRKVIITPAVQNLRVASVRDPNLAPWLDLLKLVTPLSVETGPNALARMDNGMPVVQIDMMFILKCFGISDMAGVYMSNPSEKTMFAMGKQYGLKLGESIKKDDSSPVITLNLDNLNLGPAQRVSAESMGNLAFGSVIQWVILHEIGHHQLRHFDRNPKDLTESREWELAADTWAIQKMQQLGYGLDPLLASMEMFELDDELRRSGGLIKPVELSTHPSWNQRVANLKRFDAKKPSSFGNWICIAEVSSDASTGVFFTNELLIPRRPMPGVLSQYCQFGRIVQMPVEFSNDGSVHIFGRTSAELSEITVSHLSSLYPDIYFKYTDLSTGKVSESSTRGYQMDMGAIMSSPVKGFPNLTIKDALQADPLDWFKKFLLSVENRTEVINKVVRVQEQLLSGTNNLLIAYAKGTIELTTAQQKMQRLATEKADEMKLLLGDAKFTSLREKMLASPTTAAAFEKLLK